MARERWRTAWPRIRAVLLALHVVAVVLLSFPGGRRIGDRARWKEHRTQEQLVQWGGRLRSWGLDISDEELEERLWALAQRYLGVRDALTAPFQPYAHVVPQGWGMFKAPQRQPSAFGIDVEDANGWRTVYANDAREHDYLGRLLDSNRFRKQIGRVAYDKVLFRDIARWVAGRAFVDFPEAARVRVRVEELTSLSPEEHRAGAEVPRRTLASHVFSREQLR